MKKKENKKMATISQAPKQGILGKIGSGISSAAHSLFGSWNGPTNANNVVLTGNEQGIGGVQPNGQIYYGPGGPPTGSKVVPQPAGKAATADPYAQWGGQARFNSIVSNFGAQKAGIFSSVNDALGNALIGGRNSILDFIQNLQSGQNSINRRGEQAELSKIQGGHSILDMVGRGIKSGGVMLANRNAGTSSAAQGIANAYGQLGRQGMSQVGNQYAQEEQGIQDMQDQLGQQRESGIRNIQGGKEQMINQVVSDAQNKLADLDAQIANANVPGRIAIEQEKQNIRNQAVSQLSELDQMLNSGVAGINPSSQQQRQTSALALSQAGAAPDTAFNYTTQANPEFQNSGPFASSLPIFTFPSKKRI